MEALLFCKKEMREKHLLGTVLAQSDCDNDAAPVSEELGSQSISKVLQLTLNSIDMIPKEIEVKETKLWKKKDLSKIEELTTLERIFDWSFSTPYKGCIHSLKGNFKEINKEVDMSQILNESELGSQEFKC